jgi:predicted nucleotidyltransferase
LEWRARGLRVYDGGVMGARHHWPGEVVMVGDKLTELVRQIVDAVQPEKIILFGSAARGSAGAGSDLDLLVIKSGDFHHITMAQRINAALGPRDFAVDVTVATPGEVARYGDEYCLILYPALREGKVIYDVRAA